MKAYFKNKTVIVTGASSGIGEQLVRQLANLDAKIVLCARRQANMEAIVSDIGLSEERYLILPCDFSKTVNYTDLVKQVLAKFGSIDVLINNAGIAQKSLVQDTIEEVERRIFEVNYFGTIGFTKAVLPHFMEKGDGHVVAISSILGEIGLPSVGPYCASKHAVNGYFNSLRYDVEKLGVDVSIISPGFISTSITKKSLTGTGEIHAKDSVAQEKGMPADRCAAQILKQIAKKKRQAYVGGLEVLMPKFEFFFPRLFHWLMRKMHKI